MTLLELENEKLKSQGYLREEPRMLLSPNKSLSMPSLNDVDEASSEIPYNNVQQKNNFTNNIGNEWYDFIRFCFSEMYRAQSSYKFIFSIMVLNLCLLTYTSFFKILELIEIILINYIHIKLD